MSSPLNTECNNSSQLTGQTLKDNTPALAKAMGLNETCQKLANSQFASGEISATATIPFAKIGEQAGFTSGNSAMAQSGCGQFFLNAKNLSASMNNMSCTVLQNVTKTSTDINNGASINIETDISPEYIQARENMFQTAETTLQALTLAASTSPNSNLENIITQQAAIASELSKPIETVIKSSTFSTKSGGKVITNITITSQQQEQLTSQYKDVANAAAQNQIQTTLGDQAMDPNTKTLVEQNISNNTSNINNFISSTINSTSLVVNSNSSLTIKSSVPIDIENTVFDSNAIVNIAVTHMVDSAIKEGISAANDILAQANSTTTSKASSAGVDALAKQLGQTNVNQETGALGGASGSFPWYVYVIGAVILLIVVFVGMQYMKARSGGGFMMMDESNFRGFGGEEGSSFGIYLGIGLFFIIVIAIFVLSLVEGWIKL